MKHQCQQEQNHQDEIVFDPESFQKATSTRSVFSNPFSENHLNVCCAKTSDSLESSSIESRVPRTFTFDTMAKHHNHNIESIDSQEYAEDEASIEQQQQDFSCAAFFLEEIQVNNDDMSFSAFFLEEVNESPGKRRRIKSRSSRCRNFARNVVSKAAPKTRNIATADARRDVDEKKTSSKIEEAFFLGDFIEVPSEKIKEMKTISSATVDSDNESRIEKCIEQLLYADENLHDNPVECEVDTTTSEPRIAISEDVDLPVDELMASFANLESKWKASTLVAASFDNEGISDEVADVDNDYVSEGDNEEVEGLCSVPNDDASYTTAPFVEDGMIPFDELHQDKAINASSGPPKGIAGPLSDSTKFTNTIDSNDAQDDEVENDSMETKVCVDIDIETIVGQDADDKSPRFPISHTEIQLEDHDNGNSNATMYTAQWSISIEHDLQTLRFIGSLHSI